MPLDATASFGAVNGASYRFLPNAGNGTEPGINATVQAWPTIVTEGVAQLTTYLEGGTHIVFDTTFPDGLH